MAGVLAGCGSSAAHGPALAGATPSEVALLGDGGEQRVTVHVGEVIHLAVPEGADVAELGVHELADEGGGLYRAVGVGTATLEVTRRPSCAPGEACSHLVQLVGTVRVTIAK